MLNRGGEEGIIEVEGVAECPTDGHFERTGIRRVTREDFPDGDPRPSATQTA